MSDLDPLDEIKRWKAKFRGLADWDIHYSSQDGYRNQICVSPDRKLATMYAPDNVDLADYFLHEMLHVALRDLLRTPDDERYGKEELLVQDICVLLGEERAKQWHRVDLGASE